MLTRYDLSATQSRYLSIDLREKEQMKLTEYVVTTYNKRLQR